MNTVTIIGGGASGLAAAISAARGGAIVTLLEHKDRVGKKILNTGNGKCNLTNDKLSPDKYYSDEDGFAWKVISRFGDTDTLNFFSSLGFTYKSRKGYIYPRCEQASAVLDLLRAECKALGVNTVCGVNIRRAVFEDNNFVLYTDKRIYSSDKLIMALGGKSYPVTGSDGSGYKLLDTTPHRFTDMLPALTGIVSKDGFFKSLSGVRCPGNISFFIAGKQVYSETGELQLTDYGLSGIPVFNGSRFVSRGIHEKKDCHVIIDFYPECESRELIGILHEKINLNPMFTAHEQLMGILNKKLSACILRLAKISADIPSEKLADNEIKAIAKLIKNFKTRIKMVNSFDKAQVTTGGVITEDICDNTLESKFVKGLYIIGEMLDVDAICGGYNLQFAWSTGILAGSDAAKVRQ